LFVPLQKNIPDCLRSQGRQKKRGTTLIPPAVSLPALSVLKGRRCNDAHPFRPVQAESSGASTTERPRRLTPHTGSLGADDLRLFPFFAYGNINAYFSAFLPLVNP
jgi:hypothetical protein